MAAISELPSGNWQAKVTASVVARATPRDRPWFVWDTETRGFGLMVSPGGRRSYVLKYRSDRNRAGRTRRLVIGPHGSPWTPHRAREEALRLLGLVIDGQDPADELMAARRAPTVRDLVKEWKRAHPDAVKTAMQLDWWADELGAVPLRELTGPVIAKARDALAAEVVRRRRSTYKRSPGTVNRYLAALSTALTWGVREKGYLERNPMLGKAVKRLKEPRGRTEWLNAEQRERLLAECATSRNPNLHDLVVVALSTGARASELTELRWVDVDVERGWAVLRDTKNGTDRGLPLAGRALEVLKARFESRKATPRIGPGADLVFPSPKGRAVFPREAWEKARTRAGLPGLRFHDLRHSAASYLAMAGVPLRTIAEVLGHKTLAMVQRYSHLADDHTAAAVAGMNAAIFREREAES